MRSLVTLALCVLIPWLLCGSLRAWFSFDRQRPREAQHRTMARYRRAALSCSAAAFPVSAVAGALVVDPSLSTRWPTAGAWFFATICLATTWASMALALRSAEEAALMPALETIGRATQMAALPSLAIALSLLSFYLVETLVPMVPAARAIVAALLSVAAVTIVAPWLVTRLGLWRSLPIVVQADGVSWKMAHLPVPTPLLTHAAALPWLRTVFVTDGLMRRAPSSRWQALVLYEVGGAGHSAAGRAARWSIAVPFSLATFIAAGGIGAQDPRKLVAATALAVLFTGVAGWFANREPSSKLALDSGDPSMEELAQTLRSLSPSHDQALPRTSHRPLGAALYDRLFALGHDPGRRPHP